MLPYNDIIKKRRDGRLLPMGKHKAANAKTCETIISKLEAAGIQDAAAWALWMVWWRMQDSLTHEQVIDIYKEQIAELTAENTRLAAVEKAARELVERIKCCTIGNPDNDTDAVYIRSILEELTEVRERLG